MSADDSGRVADWLFALGEKQDPKLEGLIPIAGFKADAQYPETVAVMEKAKGFGADFVFFEEGRNGRAPVPQAFIFVAENEAKDQEFASIHKRLWSWGGIPLAYRASPGRVQLFRCAHEADFLGDDGQPVCRPIHTLKTGAAIAEDQIWWDATRIRNGTIWDDPEVCDAMLSAAKSASRTLVREVSALYVQLTSSGLLTAGLRRRLLILSLLIAYLEERSVLLPADFGAAKSNATKFFEVLSDGKALIALLSALEERFNGHVFTLTASDKYLLLENTDLAKYARLVQGLEDSDGQIGLWRMYSFRDLPVELISNIYQLFVSNSDSSIYTPPPLVRLMLEEALGWEQLDQIMAGDGVIVDPACGSGVFLVEAYKRLVLHWRSKNNWQKPGVDQLRALLLRVHGVDVEEGAVELAAFSLCLSLCDALEPEEIRSTIKLFPGLPGNTLHCSCFFEAKEKQLLTKPVVAVVGNPPFASDLSTPGAKRSYEAYRKQHASLPDKQLAYLFLYEAMSLLQEGGILAMIEPSGLIYNAHALNFRNLFFKTWQTREILDFVSVRGLFKKGSADPKIVIVIAEARAPVPQSRILHAVFRRNGRAKAEQGFDIDYYDLYWLTTHQAELAPDIWRSNLLGGMRVLSLVERLRALPTLREFADKRGWDVGEGYFGGQKNSSENVGHLVGHPLLPTDALGPDGISRDRITTVPNTGIKDPKSARRFTPPFLLVKEHMNLYHDVWDGAYLTYKNEMVGFAAPKRDLKYLKRVSDWLTSEGNVLKTYVAAVSARLFTQRATSIFNDDIMALPFPHNGTLDLSDNDRIVAEDVAMYQRDFVRLGSDSFVMQRVTDGQLSAFNSTLEAQVNVVYNRQPLRHLKHQRWAGGVCTAYVFGDGDVDWSDADELNDKLNSLLADQRSATLRINRITRLYDKNFVFMLKPDRYRFWTKAIALRDADDMLSDLRAQGF